MSTLTPTLLLTKPSPAPSPNQDFANINVLNTNFDLIDSGIQADRNRLTPLESALTLNNVGIATPSRVRKLLTENVTSSTVVQDDDELFLTLVSNLEYELDFYVKVTQGGGGFQAAFTFPTVSFCEYFIDCSTPGAVSSIASAGSLTSGVTCFSGAPGGFASGIAFDVKFRIYCKPTASGTFKLQWMQQTSSASATSVLANSMATARRLT